MLTALLTLPLYNFFMKLEIKNNIARISGKPYWKTSKMQKMVSCPNGMLEKYGMARMSSTKPGPKQYPATPAKIKAIMIIAIVIQLLKHLCM